MSKSTDHKKESQSYSEARGLLFIALSLVLLVSLLTFKNAAPENNWLGLIGHTLALSILYLFGLMGYFLVLFLGFLGWKYLSSSEFSFERGKIFALCLFTVSSCLLLNLIAEHSPALSSLFANRIHTESIFLRLPYPHHLLRSNLGGAPFYYLYKDVPTLSLKQLLSDVGIGLTFSIIALVSFFLLTELRLLPILNWIKTQCSPSRWLSIFRPTEEEEVDGEIKSIDEIEKSLTRKLAKPLYMPKTEDFEETEDVKTTIKSRRQWNPLPKRERRLSGYHLPLPSLLNSAKKIDHPSLKKELRRQAEILEETLTSFGIEAKVGEINCGPTIASFEVHPAIGVKVQKITTLENDIALKLQAKSIRIIAPIPGKAAVGVEIPSLSPQEVNFKEMLLFYEQGARKCGIPILLGKTVTGENVISDLVKMPHCIIAGATGSGKSVCINTLVMSILMTATPDEIKLLMIDPKKVELTAYGRLPHMIAPVITEAHGAYAALNWLVKEMHTRYDILKLLSLRNITAFNTRTVDREGESALAMPIPEKMPFIVAIIDEFADLMMVSSSDLETPIARIAQMARAVGIHLVLATQRPSREVITGLIKANFPTRIAFKVASRINSQIILDETGAEALLGNGDMLFLPPGSSHLIRAQGAYISDDEINRIVSFICDQAPPNYLIDSFDTMKVESVFEDGEGGEARDSLYDQAYSIVVETKNASTTFLQRKLKIGYARAASLMDELEAKGVIGPQEGSKPRRVLHTPSHKRTNDDDDNDDGGDE
jgi:DNA segregation ATPase FtsK/SpoIIIE, S-DNA-T family